MGAGQVELGGVGICLSQGRSQTRPLGEIHCASAGVDMSNVGGIAFVRGVGRWASYDKIYC